MSTQTRRPLPSRQNFQRPLNYFETQNKLFGNYQPNYTTKELHNTEDTKFEDNFDNQNLEGPYYYTPVGALENEEIPYNFYEEYPSDPSGYSF